ncbi:MAG: polyamine aminopropyltransferase, partial [Buchnera aphidicola]|nr:polyamine aminopropyltransferase [Buchnera aphidicola]
MNNKKIWQEKLYDHLGQYFYIDQILHQSQTEYHKVIIFNNSIVGKVLAIDDIVQTSEKDEFIYHEMLTHVPILAHGNIKN